uniref:Uncharacterized protein n=1 Tax=Anguilla anguilla TaxID=7936 RepID=A0A0E9XFF1_ANGAN
MVGAPAGLVNKPAADPAHQQGVLHAELDDRVQLLRALLQQIVQHLCLFHSTGEAVQQEAVLAGRRVQVLLNEFHDHLVTDQFSGIHSLFEPRAELCARRHHGPQHVAGCQVTHAVLLSQTGCLRPFPCARGSEQNGPDSLPHVGNSLI